MRNLQLPGYQLFICLLSFFAFSCQKEIALKEYAASTPSSIYNLRRVAISEGLQFGQTALPAVVTSDIAGGNFNNHLLIVQDPTEEAAIAIELSADNTSLQQNDLVRINLEGASLAYKNGMLTVTGLPLSQITPTGEQRTLSAKSTSIAALLANAKYWGPLLVKLDKVNIYNTDNPLLSGNLLIDDEIAEMTAVFNTGSVFAEQTNPGFVQSMIGIALLNGTDWLLYPRNLKDIQVGLTELLEDFELSSNTSYDSKLMNFITGSWTIDGGITAATAADPKNGKQSIRLQGTIGNPNRNGIITMNFDLTGVQTLTVSYGIYPAAAETSNTNPTVFTVEVSRDGAESWQAIGSAEIDTQSRQLATTTFQVNAGFSEKMRFRVVNTSIPFANNNRPRINIDDILFTF